MPSNAGEQVVLSLRPGQVAESCGDEFKQTGCALYGCRRARRVLSQQEEQYSSLIGSQHGAAVKIKTTAASWGGGHDVRTG